jgi:N-acetylneuraminate synthase
MREMNLLGRVVGSAAPPYVIAEVGVNHEGSLEAARRLVALAASAGADAVKFQSYKADLLASRHSPAYWDLSKESTRSQHQLFSKYDSFGPDEYRELAGECARVGVHFLSTPFDAEAVEYLDPLVPAFKIASADLTNLPLLRQVAASSKPVIVSTGAATPMEIEVAVEELRRHGCAELALLHCVLNYPTPDELAHLAMIRGLAQLFPDIPIGYSDHTVPDPEMTALTTACVLGAVIVEKHFTDDKSRPGNDHYHAMDAADLTAFLSRMERIRTLLGGEERKRPVAGEERARRHARRSLVLRRDVRAGEILTPEHLIPKRPGTGIPVAHYDEVLGRSSTRALEADHVLQWEDLAEATAPPPSPATGSDST